MQALEDPEDTVGVFLVESDAVVLHRELTELGLR